MPLQDISQDLVGPFEEKHIYHEPLAKIVTG